MGSGVGLGTGLSLDGSDLESVRVSDLLLDGLVLESVRVSDLLSDPVLVGLEAWWEVGSPRRTGVGSGVGLGTT